MQDGFCIKGETPMIKEISSKMLSLILCLVLLVPASLIASTSAVNNKIQNRITKEKTKEDHRIAVLEKVYEYHESPCPKVMAQTIVNSKRPALYASLSIEESSGDPNAVGDGGKSIGAFQIQPQHWGKVPKQIDGQLQKAEDILEGYITQNKGKLRPALAMYNGGDRPPKKSYAYADRIISRAYKINQLMKQKS